MSRGAVTTHRLTPYAGITVVHLAVDGQPLCGTSSRITGGYGTADAVLAGILSGDLPCESCGDALRARTLRRIYDAATTGITEPAPDPGPDDPTPPPLETELVTPGTDERDVIAPAHPDQLDLPWCCPGCQASVQTGARCARCCSNRP